MKKCFLALILILLPVLVFAQDSPKKKAYYFYGEQCPHCHNVDEYFRASGIYDKYDIMKLEISNPFNARLLVKFGDVFRSEFKGSVPAIAFGDKFLVGDTPIIENFDREMDAAENAGELPDPDKIGKLENKENQGERTDQGNEENKRNSFPVIIGALVVAGASALVYINRKKG